jgi:dTDP-4-amino-4,6-dideoxy-D-galactose acyltransferase
MITKLEWDSKCFGYPVGKLIIEETHNFDLDEIAKLSQGFKLLYVCSKNEIPIESRNFFLTDKKILLKRETELMVCDYVRIKSYQGNVSDQLLELTYQSGAYSRFNTDRFFINNEFRKLYSEWIKNSVSRSIASDVYVYTEMDEIQGFITLAVKEKIAEIGLIAVDAKCRGHGIGSVLIKYTINNAFAFGCSEIQVVTQRDNKAALALYYKNDFVISDLTYIYHYWNL